MGFQQCSGSRRRLYRPRIALIHRLTWLLYLAVSGVAANCGTPAPVPAIHPLPSGVQNALYGDGVVPGRKTEVVSIERLAGLDHFLFVALRDSASHEILDVWNTRQPRHPELVSSIDFGNVLTNGVQFTPLALFPFPGGLLLQTRSGLSVYHLDSAGRLSFSRALPPPVTGLGLGMTQLHFAGRHGSLLQQVIPNRDITGDPNQAIHRQVLMDVSDPEEPRLLWTRESGPSVQGDVPIGHLFSGNPASFRFDPTQPEVQLTVFEPRRQEHHASYWRPKIERILRADAVHQSLRVLINRSLSAVDLSELKSRGLQAYEARCGPTGLTLGPRILEFHAPDETLSSVLTKYRVSRTESLESALAKIFQTRTSLDDEAILSKEWFAPTLNGWFDSVVEPEFRRLSAQDTRAAIGAVFNEELTEDSLVRYLTLRIIAPLLGNPEFMHWKLGDLVDALANSPAGDLISMVLRTCGGFGAVNAALGALEDLVEWIPGVRWPSCAHYPESARELAELALFSWNDASAGRALDRNGLAWFELLKFYRYLSGHTDFANFQSEVHARLQAMQQTLGENFAQRLAPALAGKDLQFSLLEANQSFATNLPSGLLLGRLIAHGVLDLAPTGDRFAASTSVDTALIHLGLTVGRPGLPESTVADLLRALDEVGWSGWTVAEVFDRAATAPNDLFGTHLEQSLRRTLQASFHGADLDASLIELLQPCIDFDVDLKGVLGSWMAGLVNEMLASGPTMSGRLLAYRHAFENQDCVAQWLVLLDAVTAATSWLGLAEVPMALEYALSEAYQSGLSYLVQTMFGALISDIMGNFSGDESLWLASQLVPNSRTWSPVEKVPDATSSILGAFTWQRRAACVIQHRFETNWFGPRALELVLCHPHQPGPSRESFDLGRWSTINYVHHHQGAVVVGGSYFAPGDQTLPTGKCLVIDIESQPPRIQHLTGDAHTPLGSAPRLTGFNGDTGLAVGGVNQVFLLPHPAGLIAAASEPLRIPQILSLPGSCDALAGASCRLEPLILGTPPFTCQWLENGSVISNATQPQLIIVASNQVATAEYTLVVRNAAGETHASTAVAFPSASPAFVQEPADLAVLSGQSANFACAIAGHENHQLQWFHQGVPIPGATQSNLLVTRCLPEHAGDYWAEATIGSRLWRTRTAHLTVIDSNPPATVGRSSLHHHLALGTTTNLLVRSVGWGPLEYRWFRNNQPIDGAHGAELVVGPATGASTGEYRVEIRDVGGQTDSQSFSIRAVGSVLLRCIHEPLGDVVVDMTGGAPLQSYVLEVSNDLTHWNLVKQDTFSASGTAQARIEGARRNAPSAFYRIVLPP
ncbi:MAG: hypothetical protein JNK85_20980 [Verrucomicrobiales bacterium]|nr:hypothetical protein [Verrucomicrobiales bacterium]